MVTIVRQKKFNSFHTVAKMQGKSFMYIVSPCTDLFTAEDNLFFTLPSISLKEERNNFLQIIHFAGNSAGYPPGRIYLNTTGSLTGKV